MGTTKWDAESILATTRAFQESRILLTGVELDVFTRLARARRTATQVARALGTDPRATSVLLDALAAMGLLAKTKQTYRTVPSAAKLLDARSEQSVVPMARHNKGLWNTWSGLTEVVRTGKPARRPGTQRTPEELRSFICGMHVLASRRAEGVAAAVRPGRAKRLLDIGAGPATYTTAFLNACPAMRATVFDLPPVIAIAREQIRKAGLAPRVDLVAGDFMNDPLPGGHDLAFLSAIIHQMSLARCRDLYAKIHAALVPGGRLVVRDHVMDPSRTRPRAGAVFAINMLVGTEGGGTFTLAEIREGLESAGFRHVKQIRSDEQMGSLVSAIRH